MKTLALTIALALCLSVTDSADACHGRRAAKVVRHISIIKRDTTHIPFFIVDTSHLTLHEWTPAQVYERRELIANYTFNQYTLQTPSSVLAVKDSTVSQPIVTDFTPFISCGLKGEAHSPAIPTAGIGIYIQRGIFQLECGATIAPTVKQPTTTINGEKVILDTANQNQAYTTAVYGALKLLL